MTKLEQQLTVLSSHYGRYPHEEPGGVGFAPRGEDPEELYLLIEDAIAAEARMIRVAMVMEQQEIVNLERKINSRLTHLGILES